MQVSTHVAVLLFILPQVLTLIAEENTTWTSQVAVSSPASSLDGQIRIMMPPIMEPMLVLLATTAEIGHSSVLQFLVG